ncbi:hypothetical protein Tco_0107759, partial [Tanacetum coccineum]
EATSIVDHCVHLLSKDEPRLGAFVEKLKSLKKEVEADCPNPHRPKDEKSCVSKEEKRKQLKKVQDEVVIQKEVCQEEVVVQKEVCQEEVSQEEVSQEKVDLAEDEEELVEEDEDLIHE